MSKRRLSSLIGTDWLIVIQPHGERRENANKNRLNRVHLAVVVVLIAMFIPVVGQMISLQIREHSRYVSLANGNRLRERIIYASRGRILDRNGVVLAESTVASRLVVYPYLLSTNTTQKISQISKVASLIGVDPAQLNKDLAVLDSSDIQAHVVAGQLDQPTIIKLEEALPKMSAFELQDIPSRRYNSDWAMGTILGYTGLVTEQNLKSDTSGTLLPTDVIGREGVEASYDQQLRGKNGREKIEVDSLGRPVSLIARQQPISGADVHLTIDINIQKTLTQAIQKQLNRTTSVRAGGVVVNPQNGDVLAMVSLPNYDDNEFVGGIGNARYAQLNQDTRQPLVNKVTTNGYPTGSIIKPLVASGALQEKVVTPETTIVDRGFLELRSQYDPNVTYRYYGWNRNGLGPMQLRSAIANSSNIYFFTVGGGYEGQPGLGVTKLTKYYRAFGLGSQTGIKLPNELFGRVPDPEWKKRVSGEDWFVGDTYNISIGQGDMLVSPLQITMAESAVANGGKVYRPRISTADPIEDKVIPVDPRNLEIVREGMRQTIVHGTTPPSMFAGVPVKVAAKSGTAETDSPGGRPPHSWYVAFAPYEHPEVLATVLVEEARDGVSYSAPAIAETMTSIFSGRQR